jgi:hypothetical protein
MEDRRRGWGHGELDQVGVDTQFVIDVADIRKGESRRGRKLPLIERPIKIKRDVTLARGGARRITR